MALKPATQREKPNFVDSLLFVAYFGLRLCEKKNRIILIAHLKYLLAI
jgi:hypothetical protein